MSAEAYPILAGAIPLFEQFMTSWENIAQVPHLKDPIEAGLKTANTYYQHMDATRAYVVAMCKHHCLSSSVIYFFFSSY